MVWAAPAYAWLLLLLLPMAWLLRWAASRQKSVRRLLTRDAEMSFPLAFVIRQWLSRLCLAAAFVFAVAALCRPQWGEVASQQQGQSRDVLIALDVSRSMLADDRSPNRLAAAKSAISRLLPKLQGDRIGLIAFAGSAFMVCPLTSDYDAFAEALSQAGPDFLPLGGTALGSALRESERALVSTKSKALILISDGEDHAGDALAAAESLRKAGITLHVVAVGAAAGGLIPLPDGAFHRDRQGGIVRSRMQPETLQSLTTAGGGRLFDLAASPDALERLYAENLAGVDKQTLAGTRKQLVERFQWPLGIALLLLFVAPLVAARRLP